VASLVNIKGPDEGSCYPVSDSGLIIVGRDDRSDIQIRDPRISRQHLQISTDTSGAGHGVADYRTANGTFVNSNRILERVSLRDGDMIRIGDTTLVYTTADYPDAETAMTEARKKGEWKRSTLIGD
jgi:DNA segregation ATPase FtsK/SpoIIIE, S-DNA-T family